MIDKHKQQVVSELLTQVDAMINSHLTRVSLDVVLTREQKLEQFMFISFVASSASMLLAGCRQLANTQDPELTKLYDDTMKAIEAMVSGSKQEEGGGEQASTDSSQAG